MLAISRLKNKGFKRKVYLSFLPNPLSFRLGKSPKRIQDTKLHMNKVIRKLARISIADLLRDFVVHVRAKAWISATDNQVTCKKSDNHTWDLCGLKTDRDPRRDPMTDKRRGPRILYLMKIFKRILKLKIWYLAGHLSSGFGVFYCSWRTVTLSGSIKVCHVTTNKLMSWMGEQLHVFMACSGQPYF